MKIAIGRRRTKYRKKETEHPKSQKRPEIRERRQNQGFEKVLYTRVSKTTHFLGRVSWQANIRLPDIPQIR